MLLKKGSRGEEVKNLQQKLISLGYNVGSYGADGVFGQGTYDAVVKFQKAKGVSADGIVGDNTWKALNGSNLLRQGSRGEEVRKLQQKLISLGYSVGLYGVDGVFGQGTHDAIVRFQGAKGLSADGIVGPNTWAALNCSSGSGLLKQGSRGEEVRKLQQRLISLGYSVGSYGADGVFGQGTHDAIVRFQGAKGLSADGIVGPNTWAALNCSASPVDFDVINGDDIERFVAVAKKELSKGFHEYNGNNITPYGEWYGMNGQAWCAMFVSWCANKAHILGSIVPRYSYCPSGVNWYRERNRYKSRTSGYVPKIGDVIFFWREQEVGHTGIVTNCNGSTVYTIEGNADNAVRARQYNLSDAQIHGYGLNGGFSPLASIKTTGTDKSVNYVFYATSTESADGIKGHSFETQAKIKANKYEKQYPGSKSILKPITSAKEFEKHWNSMGINGEKICAVELIFHGIAVGSPHCGFGMLKMTDLTGVFASNTLKSIVSLGAGESEITWEIDKSDVAIPNLSRKTMDYLYFSACNSANPDIKNVAQAFNKIVNASSIIGWDGGTIFNFDKGEDEKGADGNEILNKLGIPTQQHTWYFHVSKEFLIPKRKRLGKVKIK